MDLRITKAIALLAAGAMSLTGLAACGNSNSGSSSKGSVYFLNAKPEVADQWKTVAKEYTKETGVPVTVETAASNTYDQRIRSEMDKSNPPTLFQINGPYGSVSYQEWKQYIADMSDTEPYKLLTNKDFALTDGKKVTGVGYVAEAFGIIYNRQLLNKYFKSSWASINSMDKLDNFDALKTVADEIQAHKSDLGVQGAFTSAGMDASSNWRYSHHLANMPLYYEFKQRHLSMTSQPATIKGTYLPDFKKIFDLYLKDSTTDPKQLGSKTGDDATSEFATGKAVFYQNGTWAWTDLQKAGMKADQLGMMPIYIGAPGEEKQGLCHGTDSFWVINSKASPANQKATKKFLNWMVTSKYGKDALTKQMGFATPFKGFPATSDNPLINDATQDLKSGRYNVNWVFDSVPSQQWEDTLAGGLLKYAQRTGSWNDVRNEFVNGWASEYKASR